jgi:diguanylate cyclase
VVLYILCVAILNLAIGFILALHMARRYRQLVVAASGASAPAPASATPAPNRPKPSAPETPPKPAPPATKEPAPPQAEAAPEPDPAAGDADPAESSSTDPHPLDEILPATDPADQQPPPEATPEARDEIDEIDETEETEETEKTEKISVVEVSVRDFKGEVEQYHRELTRLDQTLRDSPDKPDGTTVKSWANSLREANLEYLGSRRQAQEALQSLHPDWGESGVLPDELREALRRQEMQIQHANGVIERYDDRGDLNQNDGDDSDRTKGSRQMLVETGKLLHVNHGLRDALDETSALLARSERRLGSIDVTKRTDRLTGLSDRVGLEASLNEWWEKDPHRVRELHAAMIDVDRFGQLNERYGQEVGDRLLRALAEMLKAKSRSNTLAVRFSGQRFFLLFPDVDLRFATSVIERIRQTIETSRFQYRSDDIQVTVSCAVVTATSEDTPEAVYARAEATVHEAKRYGRNRTFVHDGDFPAPVVPPNFTLTEKHVRI